ncbi:MAG: hypothetical protein Q8P51_00870 [Ignavibacteria bacterium]|nr:hypothetical protein [Ignavibacteria bacterium]
MSWDFTVTKPGTFQVSLGSYEISTGSGRTRKTIYEAGHKMVLTVADQERKFAVVRDQDNVERPSPYFKDIVSPAGSVTNPEAGTYQLILKPEELITSEGVGPALRWLRLVPSKGN